MWAKEFSDFAAGCKDVATTVALAAGGWWTLHTFKELGATQRARAETQALVAQLVKQPVLAISTGCDVAPKAVDGRFEVALSVDLKNDGDRALEFEDLEVKVFRRRLAGGLDPKFPPKIAAAQFGDQAATKEVMPTRILRIGQGRRVALLPPALPAGSYLAEIACVYWGLDLVKGHFKRSKDVPIHAVDQFVFRTPPAQASSRAGRSQR